MDLEDVKTGDVIVSKHTRGRRMVLATLSIGEEPYIVTNYVRKGISTHPFVNRPRIDSIRYLRKNLDYVVESTL